MKDKLSLFEDKEIRKVYKNNKWYYSIQDIIKVFTNTSNTYQYINKLKHQDLSLARDWNNLCISINMQSLDGKIRKVNCMNTIGVLRLIQSIQEEKAEPIKKWLANIGYERIEEISNPELAMDRMKYLYERKGYSRSWIEQREREITSRHSLKDEWETRGVKQNEEYIILTNEIYKNSLGIDLDNYKELKGIKELSFLKDSMTNLELALINLSEVTITEIHKINNSIGIDNLKEDINISGNIINNTKKEIEKNLNKDIVSSENHMNLTFKD